MYAVMMSQQHVKAIFDMLFGGTFAGLPAASHISYSPACVLLASYLAGLAL